MDERALLHILLFVLEDEHLHALGLEFAQDLQVALETVVEVAVGLSLVLDQLDKLGKLVLLEVVNLVAVDEQVDGAAGGRDAASRACFGAWDWACSMPRTPSGLRWTVWRWLWAQRCLLAIQCQ